MSWILAGIYCGFVWLVFAKLKLLRLTLPIAIVLASAGPLLIVALLFCAQYFHPYTPMAIVVEKIDPISVQLTQPGRVTEVLVEPNVEIRKGDVLFRVDEEPYRNAVEVNEASLAQAIQNVELAKSSVDLAEATTGRTKGDLEYAESELARTRTLRESNAVSQKDLEQAETVYKQAIAADAQANERLQQATVNVQVAISQVQQAETTLKNSRYNLEQTTIVAPADGYVTNLQVRPGLLVSAGSGPVMTFIRKDSSSPRGIVVATFAEKSYLRIKPGQYTELAMDGYPGEILTGRVLSAIDVSGTGQLDASGRLPTSLVGQTPTLFAVNIQLDDPKLRLPGGAQGQAAVYTEDIQIAGIPVMFLIRAKSWLNYLF